jgi:hypothetical protein
MQEVSGNRTDVTGNGLTLTDNNTVTSEAGHVESLAARFTSANSESLSRPDAAVLDFGTQASIQCWVYFIDPGVAYRATIGVKGVWTAISWFVQVMPVSGADTLVYFSSADYVNDQFVTFAYDTWYHLAWVYDGSLSGISRSKMYRNAVEILPMFIGGAGAPALLTNTAGDFRIGGETGLARYFNGRMEQYGLSNQALTQTDITYLYNAGAGRVFGSA